MLSPVMQLRVLLLALVCACGGKGKPTSSSAKRAGPPTFDAARPTTPDAFPIREPFARPGEGATYRLSLLGVEVASFAFGVGEPTELDGRAVVVVQSGVQDAGVASLFGFEVSDNFTAWIDAKTTKPILFRADELASRSDPTVERIEADVAALADGKFPVRVTRPDTGEVIEQQAASEHPLYDLNGFLMVLRTWDAEPGTTATADIIRSRYIWRTQITMVGYESIVTELGEVGALKVQGASRRINRDGTVDESSDTRRYQLWISDDADRVPLKIVAHADYGDLEMEIVSYQPPPK